MRAWARTAKIALCALVCCACSAIVDADPRKLGPKPVPCEPKVTEPCVCPNGRASVQRCNALRRLDPCECSGAARARAAAGAPGD